MLRLIILFLVGMTAYFLIRGLIQTLMGVQRRKQRPNPARFQGGAEMVSVEADAMVKEGRDLAKIHKNIVVKIPMLPEGLKAVRRLKNEGIRVNVTLIFSPTQALLAAKSGASYVSPFVGRLDDVSQ